MKIKMMALTVLALTALGALPAAANTGDHSGFGRSLFVEKSPAGFNDPIAYSVDMDAAAAVANGIEPAAGTPKADAKVSAASNAH